MKAIFLFVFLFCQSSYAQDSTPQLRISANLGSNYVMMPSASFNYQGQQGIAGSWYHYEADAAILKRYFIGFSVLMESESFIVENEYGVCVNNNERVLYKFPEYHWDRSPYVYGRGYGSEQVTVVQSHPYMIGNMGFATKMRPLLSNIRPFVGGGIYLYEMVDGFLDLTKTGTFLRVETTLGQYWEGWSDSETITTSEQSQSTYQSFFSYFYLWAGLSSDHYRLSIKIGVQSSLSLSYSN